MRDEEGPDSARGASGHEDNLIGRRACATWLVELAHALGAPLPAAARAAVDALWRGEHLDEACLASLTASLVDEDSPGFSRLEATRNSALVGLYSVHDAPGADAVNEQVEEAVDHLLQGAVADRYVDTTFVVRDVLHDINAASTSRAALEQSARGWAAAFRDMP